MICVLFYFILEFPRIFTPDIVREIAKSLSYKDKRLLSITHRNFEFSQTFEFIVVEKYSRLISDWDVFRDDTSSEIEKEIECNFYLRQVFLNLINYVGCKPVPAHLLFCRQLYSQNKPCTMCTRMCLHSQVISRRVR